MYLFCNSVANHICAAEKSRAAAEMKSREEHNKTVTPSLFRFYVFFSAVSNKYIK